MQITQVRNATQIIEYASARFLIDPMLSPKDAFPAFAGTPNEERRNPTVELPFALDRIVDVDAVIVTHTHMDHWDPAASAALAKAIPLFAQNEKDAEKLRGEGFTDVRLLTNDSRFGAIRLTKTPGQHGSDEAIRLLGQRLGEVCGVVFRHEGERSLYLAGDTVWNAYVAESIATHAPEAIVLNCGDARIHAVGPIIMGVEDVRAVAAAAPRATIVATHMEAVNHATLSRADLRQFARDAGFVDRLIVPGDGETIVL